MRILSADWVVPVDGPPIPDGAVAIDDGVVVAVGAASDIGRGERFDDSVIAPAFVNAHSHLEYAAYAGFGDGLPFPSWIGLHVERKARLDATAMADVARAGALACLRSGIGTVGDASFSGAAALAAADTGLRATVYLEVFGADSSALDRFHELRDRVAPALSDRVRIGVSPHAPYTCSLEVYEACSALDVPLTTHLSESTQELEYLTTGGGEWAPLRDLLVDPPGTTGIRLLADAGLLGPAVVAAHCVHADAEEVALLAATATGVAHCPRSNAYLGCGIAPLTELRDAGGRVAVATDSPASTPSFDMFAELRAAIELARARERTPTALSAADALELATLGGARALRREDDLGSLTPGKLADLMVVSLQGSPFSPAEDPAVALVLGGSPERVTATLVAGDERYRKGTTAWPVSTRAARRARSRMLQ